MTDHDTGGTHEDWDDSGAWTDAGRVTDRSICPTCFGDKTITNGSPSPDSPPGSVTWCPSCHGTGVNWQSKADRLTTERRRSQTDQDRAANTEMEASQLDLFAAEFRHVNARLAQAHAAHADVVARFDAYRKRRAQAAS